MKLAVIDDNTGIRGARAVADHIDSGAARGS